MNKAARISGPTPFAGAARSLAGLRYLLVVPVPYHAGADGAIWLDPLWLHDLRAHLDYIDDLTVLAPSEPYTGQPGLVKLPADMAGLKFVALPAPASVIAALIALPGMLLRSLRAIRRSDVVHSGVAGWPIPPGLVVNPLAALLRKPLIIVIESAFWRLADPEQASLKARLRARLTEAFARWSVRVARLGIFTHCGYRDSLKGRSRAHLLVAPASWIAETDILPQADALARWAVAPKRPRFILAARLIPEKGIGVVQEALKRLDADGVALQLDIVGTGPLRSECERLAHELRHVRLGLPDPAPYGAEFFALLRRYQAVIVPGLSDEQPRIIFDAYSQAIPVIASDTAGNREIVEDGETGWLLTPGDAVALADCLRASLDAPARLRDMGLAARDRACAHTHVAMHLERAGVLAQLFGKGAGTDKSHDEGEA